MNLELVSELEELAEKIKPLDAFENFLGVFLDQREGESGKLILEGVVLLKQN